MQRFLKWVPMLAMAAMVLLPADAQMMYPGYGHEDWGWGHAIAGPFMMILFWGGIILVIIFAVRGFGGGAPRHPEPSKRNNALEILNERFARGEIEKEEFEERKRLISD